MGQKMSKSNRRARDEKLMSLVNKYYNDQNDFIQELLRDQENASSEDYLTSQERSELRNINWLLTLACIKDQEQKALVENIFCTWNLLPQDSKDALTVLVHQLNSIDISLKASNFKNLKVHAGKCLGSWIRERRLFWNCISHLADIVSQVGSFACSVMLATVSGFVFGPCGAGVGAGLGIVLGSWATKSTREILHKKITELAKSKALRYAYKKLNVSEKASMREVNDAYKKLSMNFYPGDKTGGLKFLQKNMALIVCTRDPLQNNKIVYGEFP